MTTTAITSKIGRQDITYWDGVSPTFTRRTSVGGTLTLSRVDNIVDVCTVYGNGDTRTSAIINDAISVIGIVNTVGLDFGPGQWVIDVNVTIPANLKPHITPGSLFSISSGKVITFSSQVYAGSYRIFSGSGTVAFANGSVIKTSWFGGIVNLLTMLSGSPNINVIFDMDETIFADRTVPANIRVSSPYGYVVTINNGVTLTISGEYDSGNMITTNLIGTGQIIYGSTPDYSASYIYPQLYGAVGNGIDDDTTAMQDCFDAGYNDDVPIYLPPGTYLCGALTYGSNEVGAESSCSPLIFGSGSFSIIKAISGTSGVFITAKNIKNKTLRDFVIDANDVAGITEVINTDWYASGAKLNNIYRNIKIKNYPAKAWSGENNGSCEWDQISIEDPTTSTNQNAADITGDIVNLTDWICNGYILFTGDNLKIDSSFCYGLNATAENVSLINSKINSNNVTNACVDGIIKSLSMIGGELVTTVGRNHISGTYDLGGSFQGTYFNGASGENIFASDVTATTGISKFNFLDCKIDANVMLNFSANYYISRGVDSFISGASKNLVIVVTGVATVTVNADEVLLSGPGYSPYKANDIDLTLNMALSGAGGRDTGAEASSTWYAIYICSDGITDVACFSTSATTPNASITDLYPYFARVGWVRNDGSSNLTGIIQRGTTIVTSPALMASGISGSPLTWTWTAVAVGNFVPSTAKKIKLIVTSPVEANTTYVAPDSGYNGSNPPPIQCNQNNFHSGPFEFVLESSNIYYISETTGALYCFGWED